MKTQTQVQQEIAFHKGYIWDLAKAKSNPKAYIINLPYLDNNQEYNIALSAAKSWAKQAPKHPRGHNGRFVKKAA